MSGGSGDADRGSSTSLSSSSGGTGNTVSELARRLENPDGVDLGAFDDSYRLYQRLIGLNTPRSVAWPHPGASERAAGDRSTAAPAGSVAAMTGAYASALAVLGDAFRLYGPDCVYGSYNGGKDAVAIMHLMRAALAHYSVKAGRIFRPRLIYFRNPKEFKEVEALVYDTTQRYDLELVTQR